MAAGIPGHAPDASLAHPLLPYTIPEYGEEEDKEYLRRLRHMRKLLDEGTDRLVPQLLAWERQTLKTLGLAEYFPKVG